MKYGDKYEMLMGSWAAPSGMYLELWERQPSRQLALWAFYSDADESIEFERHVAETPAEVESWFHEEARRRLPKLPDAEAGAAADSDAFPPR